MSLSAGRNFNARHRTLIAGYTVGALLPALLILITAAPLDAQERQRQERFERQLVEKARRDAKFRELYEGVLDMQKTTYESRIGGLTIPVYVFQPLEKRGLGGHPGLLWIHGGVHGDLDPEHYAPYIREAVERGYVVVAPEYRGSTGYGQEHYDAIDYGGWEVDDVLTAADFIEANLPHVDMNRLGIIGWSHGGFITLHSIFQEPETFKVAASMVPVTNLIFRLSYKGPGYQRSYITQERIGGLPHQRRDIYVERSPIYHVQKLQTPLIVHLARNDRDVNIEEAEQMVWALEYYKSDLVETRIYENPPGGHSFQRRVDEENNYAVLWSKELQDSWDRTWTFLAWYLEPWRDTP
jgi:dipeptidyl aminopeptidase/acylaminoacyl peptidase